MPRELTIGTLIESEDAAPAQVLAAKLNRHTFWCGQSGSGKTYALGVLLEQVLLHTRLPLVILDPNSDFARLGEVRDDAPADVAAVLRDRDIRVFRSGDPDRPLRARLLGMPLRSRAAILGIDPVVDAELYNEMLHLEAEVGGIEQGRLIGYLRAQDSELRQ